MNLSIIIINWNTRDLLSQCLASIDAYAPPCQFDVWVVDNASSDGSADMVRSQFPHVRLIENTANVGFAKANNQAIGASSGRYILLLNSDTIVQPGALIHMTTFMDEHSAAGIVGARVQNADGTPQTCFGKFPSFLSEAASACGLDSSWPFSTRDSSLHGETGVRKVDWVLGAAMLIRREALDQVGTFDERYFMYSEEIDLAYRIRQAGWSNYSLGAAPIVHLGQQSSRQAPASMKAALFRSKVLYFRKHYGRIVANALECVLAASIVTRRWVYRLQGKSGLGEVWSETWRLYKYKSTQGGSDVPVVV